MFTVTVGPITVEASSPEIEAGLEAVSTTQMRTAVLIAQVTRLQQQVEELAQVLEPALQVVFRIGPVAENEG